MEGFGRKLRVEMSSRTPDDRPQARVKVDRDLSANRIRADRGRGRGRGGGRGLFSSFRLLKKNFLFFCMALFLFFLVIRLFDSLVHPFFDFFLFFRSFLRRRSRPFRPR
jgi:hypothetical protein